MMSDFRGVSIDPPPKSDIMGKGEEGEVKNDPQKLAIINYCSMAILNGSFLKLTQFKSCHN